MKRPAGGKFSYNDDIRKFQGKKHAESIKKKELETKRFQKAAALRKYAKLCKAEGIQSDRVYMGKKEDRPTGDIKENKKVEYKPFRRAEREAERLQALEAEKERQRQENLQLKEEAIRKRDEKRKALSKKTKKGQPVLGNQIKNILEKLQTAH